jgi:hypothetical protein
VDLRLPMIADYFDNSSLTVRLLLMINDSLLKQILLGYAQHLRHNTVMIAGLAAEIHALSETVLQRDPALSEVLARKKAEVDGVLPPLVQDSLEQLDETIRRLNANEVAW